MNKNKLLRVALVLLPLLVVLVVIDPASVTVIGEQEVNYVSFMHPVEESSVGWCAPVAALLNYVLFGMAVLHLLTGKEVWLKGIFGLAFAAATIAALPVIVNTVPKVVPSVLAAILLGTHCIVAKVLLRPEQQKQETKVVTLR